MTRAYIILLVILATANVGVAQEVLVSTDLSVRQAKKYLILGEMKDNVLLFRDEVSNQYIDVLDQNLKFKYRREVNIGRDSRIHAVMPHGDMTSIVYSEIGRDSVSLVQLRIDHKGERHDTTHLAQAHKRGYKPSFKYSYSEDRTKLALFRTEREMIPDLYVIDLSQREILYQSTFKIKDATNYEFMDMVLTNEAEIYLLFERNNHRSSREKHTIMLGHVAEGMENGHSVTLPIPEYLSKDLHLTYDELNDRALAIGLYTDANRSGSYGYFYAFTDAGLSISADDIEYHEFDDAFIREANGITKGANNTLDYYFIEDVIFHQDGGFTWIGEMFKEFTRRNQSSFRGTRSVGGTYTDYYTENLILFSLEANGDEAWRRVIYKKQHSQDDYAAYSSYYLMRTPKRLKLLLNDEISRNNTVSAYSLDPIGNIQRKTVLNTEFENLRLRFKKAMQVGNQSLLVPSEKAGAVNVVKIRL